MANKVVVTLEKRVTLLRAQRDPSLVHAGFDEDGKPFLIIDPDNMTQRDRDDFASLFMEAAANFTGSSAGRVVH
jgi:hypothetical protein